MKIKIKKEVWIGIVVIGSLGVLYWGMNFLKGKDIFREETFYYSVYDKIEGLSISNPVQINGYTVGRVREISFHPDNSGRIIVEMSISREQFKLPLNTIAKITSLDLLGSKAINLKLGNKNGYHNVGDTLRSAVEASISDEVNKQIEPLKRKAEDLLASMDTAIQIVKAILNEEARQNITNSFKNFNNAMGTFDIVAKRVDTMIFDEKAKLASIMTNFNSISFNLRNNNENITMILDNIAFITDSIAASNVTETINNASRAFKAASDIMAKIERGEGSIGQLINNDSLYYHLESSARNLDKLLMDIEEHPSRYVHISVFGGKDKEDKRREKDRKRKEKEQKKLDRKNK